VRPAESVDVFLPAIETLRRRCPKGVHELRLELRLSRPGYFPLKAVPLQPHPTQIFDAAFSMLQEDLQEDLIVDWSFLPVPGWRLYRLRSKLLEAAEQEETHGLLRILRREAAEAKAPQGRGTPAVSVERASERKGLQEKVGQGEPLFHFQL